MAFDPESQFSQRIHTAYKAIAQKLIYIDTEKETYSRRLVQQIANKNHAQILSLLRKEYGENLENSDPHEFSKFIQSHVLQISKGLILKTLIRSLLIWFGGFFYITLRKLLNKTRNQKILIIDSPIQNLADPKLFFATYDRILRPHFNETNYLVLAKYNCNEEIDQNNYLCKVPILDSLKLVSISSKDLILFYKLQVKAIFEFLSVFSKEPISIYMINDFLTMPYVKLLDLNHKLIAYIKSNSEYQDQQYWLETKEKKFSFYTIWYSSNTMPLKTRGNESYDWYLYHLSFYENSFTWVDSHAKWLTQFTKKRIILIPPLVFYKNKEQYHSRKSYISIFDIPPFNPDYLGTFLWNNTKILYTEENSKKFIRDIIDIVKDEFPEFDIVIKSKRVPGPNNIKTYFEFLEEEDSKGHLKILSPELSAEDLIRNSKLTISMPFTSTNHIAAFHKIPAIYYDPSGRLDPNGFFDNSAIKFAQDKDQLRLIIKKLL